MLYVFADNNINIWNLTNYGFSGYPLRKDFPISGFTELVYSDSKKLIKEVSIELIQQYRLFTFNFEWFKEIKIIDINLKKEENNINKYKFQNWIELR